MLFPGTEMHLITFVFICFEIVIAFYLVMYKLARPDDKTTTLDIFLLLFLLMYNISGGLLPDPQLPGSFFVQEIIAYATGFITPCYFPYYVYKGFDLKAMAFHAFKGVYIFLAVPYFVFVTLFALTHHLETAKQVLVVPALYAVWVLVSMVTSIRKKYGTYFLSKESIEEMIVVFCCLAPWVGLPVLTYFNLSQAVEVTLTNTGFLLLMGLHLKRNIIRLRTEHRRLMESEKHLKNWNERLQQEVTKRTMELERLSKEERFKLNCQHFSLTNREKEVAFCVFTGCTYKQIADQLFISERTVSKHIQNIFEKLQVSNRSELCHKLGV